VRADREYLRSSILKPTAHVANGFQAAMPSYSGILDAGQIESLIVYLSQLR
jgi:cytochrome c oxidase subunit 2